MAQAKVMQAALSSMSADVKTKFNDVSASAQNMGQRVKSGLRLAGDGADDAARQADRAGDSFLSMHKGLVAAAGAAVSLGGPAMTALSGTVVGLGGALIGAGAGLGIFMAAAKPLVSQTVQASSALQQYQQALSAGNTKAAASALKQYQLAIAQMTPAQIQATLALNDFRNSYQTWYQQFSKPIGNLMTQSFTMLSNLLPKLTPVITGVAGALQSVVSIFSQWIQSSGFNQFISMVSSVAQVALPMLTHVITDLFSVLGSFFNAAMPIIEQVLQALVRGADLLAGLNFGQILQPFIEAFQKDGPMMAQFLEALISIVVQLFHALAPIGQAVASVFTTLLRALIPIIQVIGQALQQIMPVVGALAGMLAGVLGKVIQGLVPILVPLVALLGELANTIGAALMNSLQVVAPLLEGLLPPVAAFVQALVQGLAPAMGAVTALVNSMTPLTFLFEPIAKTLAQLTPLFAQLGSVIAALLGPAIQIASVIISIMSRIIETDLLPILMKLVGLVLATLLPIFKALVPVLNLVANVLGEVMADAIRILTPFIKALAAILATIYPILGKIIATTIIPFIDSMLKAVQKLLPPLTQFGVLLGQAVLQVIKAILPILPALVNALLQILNALLPILPALVELLAALIPILDPVIKLTALVITLVADALVPLVKIILDVLTPVLKVVIAVIRAVIDVVVLMVTHWKLMGEILLAVVTGGLALIPMLIYKYWNDITGFTSKLWNDVTGFFKAIWHDATYWVGQLGTDLVKFFTDLPGKLASVGAHAWDWLLDGLRAVEHGIADIWNKSIGSLSVKIPSWIPGIGGDGFSMPKIPYMAEGGIVTRPTLAIIGEAGPEAVVPLRSGNSSVASGLTQPLRVTVDYHPTFQVPAGTSQEMLDSMQRLIDRSYQQLVTELVARYMPA